MNFKVISYPCSSQKMEHFLKEYLAGWFTDTRDLSSDTFFQFPLCDGDMMCSNTLRYMFPDTRVLCYSAHGNTRLYSCQITAAHFWYHIPLQLSCISLYEA